MRKEERGAPVVTGVPGLDFTTLSLSAQRELNSVLEDEFCYCGCPHSLGVCLKSHAACPHARKMVVLAAAQASTGVSSVEISNTLSKYYLSFREKRQQFKIDSRMCKGPENAKVTLLEFSDFECPYCASARPLLEDFAQQNASKVRLCFVPFPLPAHSHSTPAAAAALFARDRGKFWEMHDLLFQNQADLSNAHLQELASRVGLPASGLAAALQSGKYNPELEAGKASGSAAGVDATPAVYVNGRKLGLMLTPEVLRLTVDDETEWTENRNAWAPD